LSYRDIADFGAGLRFVIKLYKNLNKSGTISRPTCPAIKTSFGAGSVERRGLYYVLIFIRASKRNLNSEFYFARKYI